MGFYFDLFSEIIFKIILLIIIVCNTTMQEYAIDYA